jgi:integrase
MVYGNTRDVVARREHLTESYSPASIALHLTSARRFYGYLVEEGILLSNPFSEVKAPKRKNGKKRKWDTITEIEWESLLATCDDSPAGLRDKAILLLAYELGLRGVEIIRADIADLRTSGDSKKLWIQGKGDQDKSEWMFIPQNVETAINDWLAVRGSGPGALFWSLSKRSYHQKLSMSYIRTMWNERKKTAKITGDQKTFHSLRHTAIDSRARYAVKHGKSPYLVQEFARHKSPDTTMQYIHDVERESDPPELWGTNTNNNAQ